MGLVLVCDVLYGKGVRCGGILKFAITRHIEDLKCAKEHLLESRNHSGLYIYIYILSGFYLGRLFLGGNMS